ncbi:MAG: hypothetical protein IPG45_32710 [Deltaproteobacteria bacterium]|jgi:hypothetical protein|nr:hypothetical protein [Deltaproteobacteria bacterium]
MRSGLHLFAAIALFTQSGCGIILQSAFGWSSERTETVKKTHSVQVKTAPAGAQVTRRDPEGNEQVLGQAPFTDTLFYERTETIESPSSFGLYLGGVLSVGAGIGALVVATSGSSGSTTDDPFADSIRDTSSTAGDVLLAIGGGTLLYLGVQDLLIGLIYGASGESVKSTSNLPAGTYTYTADVAGLPQATATVKPPDQSYANLILDGSVKATNLLAVAPPPPSPPPVAPTITVPPPSKSGQISSEAKTWVIAVMEVEQVETTGKSVDGQMVKNLGDQLRIFVAQSGVRTIDRGAQERAFKDQIQTMKSESYKECYDNSCQIELGKALAASHILRSRIAQFGSKCVLNAELIDLRSEVTVKASSARGACEPEGFLGMSEEVAQTLVE